MNVQSHLFVLAYLPAVLVLWRLLGERLGGRAAQGGLVCAGVLFCGWGSPWSLLVLAGEGALSFLLGRRIAQAPRQNRLLLWTGSLTLLAVLAFFKYTGFALSLTPLEGLFSPPAYLAPLGLSFVTFQQIFWLRDCYDREVGTDVTPLDYACCLTFFATATCGPITRVGELAPQLRTPAPLSWDDLAAGLYCFSLGLAKKVLAATVFANGANYGFANAWTLAPMDCALTILCYTLQIYFDFSGYSDMAIGLGTLLGFETPENFDYPYVSASITEFWRRWHLSLSFWFRDYLYIPLGGGRRGTARKCWNKAVVFLLCGLWHGASWTFVLWGAWHGLLSAVESALPMKRLQEKPLGRWLGHVYTLLAVCVGFVVFRAASVSEAMTVLRAMFTGFTLSPASTLALERISPAVWCALGAGMAGSLPLGPWLNKRLMGKWLELSSYAGAAALFVLCLLAAAGSSFQPFIYAQF